MGNLGHALAAYSGFATRGFRVVALLDRDPEVVGQQIAGLTVSAMADLEQVAVRAPRRDRGDRHPRRLGAGRL